MVRVKVAEPKPAKSLVFSLVLHVIFLTALLASYSCSTEKTVLVSLQKNPQKATEQVKASVIDKRAVDQAFQRKAMEEKLIQQKILEQQQQAEKLRLEAEQQRIAAEQQRIAAEKAHAAKLQLEAEHKKAAQQKILQEKAAAAKQLQAKKQAEQKAAELAQQAAIKQQIDAQKAAKKAADAAALKAKHDRMQAEHLDFLASEVDKFKAEFAAAIEENRILSSVFAGDIRCKLRIKLLPDGSILNVSVIQASGNPAYDEMSTNAVYKAAPFPMPEDKELYDQLREIVLSFRNGEQTNEG